ncbi:MAG TPA: DciA family protein [Steroidobacteraceae bacterium]|nr:DciA family protein [Steroidobacteraceae bacterium]
MSDRFKHVSEDLGPLIANLERRVQSTVDLTMQVRTALQGAEKDHIVSVTCRDDTLVVLADSAAWCPRIRYAQQQVLDALRANGETRFTKLKVKVGRKSA